MTSEDVKFAISVGMPSLMVLVGILVNYSRLSDLRHLMDRRFDSVDKRFDDLTRIMEARFQAQDENFTASSKSWTPACGTWKKIAAKSP